MNTSNRRNGLGIGSFLFIFETAAILLPVPFAVICVFGNLDPFYFITEQFVFSCPYNRPGFLMLASFTGRLFLTLIWLVEFGRFAGEVVVFFVAALLILTSILNNIFRVKYSHSNAAYTMLTVPVVNAETFLIYSVGEILFLWHFLVVALSWLVVTCYGFLPEFAFYALLLMMLIVISGLWICLSLLSKMPILSEAFIQNNLLLYYKPCTQRKSHVAYKSWKPQPKFSHISLTFCLCQSPSWVCTSEMS